LQPHGTLPAALIVLGLVSWLAQPMAVLAAADAAPSATAKAASPSVPEPEPIAVSEIPDRVLALEAQLRKIEPDVQETDAEKQFEESLPGAEKAIRSQQSELDAVLAGSPSLSTLASLETRWKALTSELATQDPLLEARLKELEKRLGEIQGLAEVWKLTAELAREKGAPPKILKQVSTAQEHLARMQKDLEQRRNAVLDLASRGKELQGEIDASLARIGELRQQLLSQILVRDAAPLWSAHRVENVGAALGALRHWYVAPRAEIAQYARQHRDSLILNGLLILGLLWVSVRTRARAKGTGEIGEQEGGASGLLRHPVAAALVVGLVASVVLHLEAPRVFTQFIGLLLLPPLVVVLRAAVPASLRPVLYGLAALFFVDRVREAIELFPLASRLLFLLEIGVAAGGLAWLQRPKRLGAIPEALVRSGWMRPLGLWLRISSATLVVTLGAAVFGYMRLAVLLGAGTFASFYGALGLLTAVLIADELIPVVLRGDAPRRSRMIRQNLALFERLGRRGMRLLAVGTWVYIVLERFQIREATFAFAERVLSRSFGYGTFSISLGGIVAFAIVLWLSWLLARMLDFVLNQEVYARISLPRGVPYALSSLSRYTIIALGFLLAVAMLGFNLDRLTILFGAVGVGVGFGLQNVVNNFVSGLILLFERPVNVGDRVEVAELLGDVKHIGIRASIVRTFDGADVIVPNGNFISDMVTNWTLSDRLRRIIVSVGVAYGTDPERVLELLRSLAERHPDVLSYPEPRVYFRAFGESSLDFELRVWTDKYDERLQIESDLAVATAAALKEAGIEIPFPQRDLHLRSVSPKAREAFGTGGGSGKTPRAGADA
jgi:small-conductance mechanosensitive channel